MVPLPEQIVLVLSIILILSYAGRETRTAAASPTCGPYVRRGLAPDPLGRLGPLRLLEGGELRLDLHPLLDEAADGLLIVLLPLLALLPEVGQLGLARDGFSGLCGRPQDLGRPGWTRRRSWHSSGRRSNRVNFCDRRCYSFRQENNNFRLFCAKISVFVAASRPGRAKIKGTIIRNIERNKIFFCSAPKFEIYSYYCYYYVQENMLVY